MSPLLQCYICLQDARLKQLSTDLRSDLNSSCLTQLKELVSDLVQQLKDSMARQAQPHRQTHPTLALTLGCDASPSVGPTDLLSLSLPEELSRRPKQHHAHEAAPLDPTHGDPRHFGHEEVLSSRQSCAQSVLTDSETELGLAESQASSVIAEEEVAATHMAESVAESVSDFQYSMDFESSIHRSPLSGFRSPAAGESTVGCYPKLELQKNWLHHQAGYNSSLHDVLVARTRFAVSRGVGSLYPGGS